MQQEMRQSRAPFRWFKDESFWKDVTSQTLATLSAAIVLAFVVILTGGYTPAVRYYVAMGLVTILFLLFVLALAIALVLPVGQEKITKAGAVIRFLIATAAALILAFDASNIYRLISEAIQQWSGYAP